MDRSKHLKRLKTQVFDCLIIGGGASGTGCALDSTLRGYTTALIEKEDFAAATSSKSTKLIHGGVRYLEQAFKNLDLAQLNQVRHGLSERHTLLRNAPHLAQALPLLTPVFGWFEGLYYSLGLNLYDFFATEEDLLPDSEWLDKEESLARMPILSDKVEGAVLYYDGQFNDARYNLALAQSAAQAGATLANHISLSHFEHHKDGRIKAAIVEDHITQETFRIQAKAFINCTGAFADQIRQKANPKLVARVRPSKGVHLVVDKELIDAHTALLIPKTKDGRIVFAVPFHNKVIIGTTDDQYTALAVEPSLEAQEVQFLLDSIAPYLKQPIQSSDISAGFGGLRPLIAAEDRENTKALLRDHEVEYDQNSHLISLLGGKWTSYRLMAQDTIDGLSEHILKNDTPCSTDSHKLYGAQQSHAAAVKKQLATKDIAADIQQHLYHQYGDQVFHFLDFVTHNNLGLEKLHPTYAFLKAEVQYAARYEMAYSIRDFLARRIRLEILDWQAAIDVSTLVAQELAIVHGWTSEQTLQKAEKYQQLLKKFQQKIAFV